jgi:uncharacterized protein involved in response to NO
MAAPVSRPRERVRSGDATIDRRGRRLDVPPILSYGFRPFFLAGALYAALAIPLWLSALFLGVGPAGVFAGAAWHAHEMIFGYLGAVIAGFILTAVPNWTGRLPLSGAPLAILVAAWAAGRVVAFLPAEPAVAAPIDLAFPVMLAAAIWREIAAGRNYRNVPVAGLVSLFAAANLVDYLSIVFPDLGGHGIRLALGAAATMIALIGGRITPSFTRNWMARGEMQPLPAAMGSLDQVALATTAVAAVAWVVRPDALLSALLLVAAGALLFTRLSRWRGWRTLRSPIVLVLHLGYLWLSAALILLGAATLLADATIASAGIHALTAGAVGTMTLAVMTRASLGHTGRAIETDGATAAIYALVTIGALIRVAAPFLPAYEGAIIVGGLTWSAAFALFVLRYGPMLVRPRVVA